MFAYYLDLALRSLRRNPVLTALMVLAIGLGIGASMTTLTVFRLLSGDPLPQRSGKLFYPQVDPRPAGAHDLPAQLTYIDAMNLWQARRADRQAIMVGSNVKVKLPQAGARSVSLHTLATTTDFFPMFGVTFLHGGPWTAADESGKARVAVLSRSAYERLFQGRDGMGQSIRLGHRDFRIVGVIQDWRPAPHFYDLDREGYGQGDDLFIPFPTSRDLADLEITGYSLDCFGNTTDDTHLENQPCLWLKFWVELDTPAKVSGYRDFLANYSREQQAQGRFTYVGPPRIALPDVMQWLDQNGVVPSDVRLKAWIAFGFLLVCLMNTTGLLLAKFLQRTTDISVRRALGASRRQVFFQCLVEAATVGVAGGVLGLLLAWLGLWGIRHSPAEYADLAQLDIATFVVTFALSIAASLGAGLLPAWRACHIAPALQLKTT
ncbi:FtsX-like permease family protein [Rhodanobacter glycinis]|uniref:FtsX-like permease family protein n=1 Tax=Rhodanobacter glycinis TaxID=582702 RepID=A0A502C6X2_9GAMM|nr:ABC transporter permease [Rhodanobacter glycinis]TPG08563.1 FtsX-like permease family protein [Rhodanobacter glycinis]